MCWFDVTANELSMAMLEGISLENKGRLDNRPGISNLPSLNWRIGICNFRVHLLPQLNLTAVPLPSSLKTEAMNYNY